MSSIRWGTGRIVVLLAGLALTVAACTSSANDNGSSDPAGGPGGKIDKSAVDAAVAPYLKAPTTLPVTAPLRSRPPAGKTIYFLSEGLAVEQATAAGLREATAALGWTLKMLQVNPSNPSTYNSAMLTAVNAGATAVAVDAVPTEFYRQALAVAHKAGVFVVDAASGNAAVAGVLQVQHSSVAGPVWGQVEALGALADAAKSGHDLNLLQVWISAYATISGPINDGAKTTMAKYCPSCTYALLDVPLSDLAAGKVPSDIVSYLQKHPKVNTLGFPFDSLEIGVRQALDHAGLNKMKIYGVEPQAAQFAELRSGKSDGWAIAASNAQGWMIVDAVARELETPGGGAVYATHPAPTMLATGDDNPPTDVPVNYQSQFKRLWHVG